MDGQFSTVHKTYNHRKHINHEEHEESQREKLKTLNHEEETGCKVQDA